MSISSYISLCKHIQLEIWSNVHTSNVYMHHAKFQLDPLWHIKFTSKLIGSIQWNSETKSNMAMKFTSKALLL